MYSQSILTLLLIAASSVVRISLVGSTATSRNGISASGSDKVISFIPEEGLLDTETIPDGSFDVSSYRMLALSNCHQSSNFAADTKCERAIDGKLSQNCLEVPCSQVSDNHGWWSAKTPKAARIRGVRIYNRRDCCSGRLTDFEISVDGFPCAVYRATEFFSVKTFKCNAYGQNIKIESRREHLTLVEVQVFSDAEILTLSQCDQSSTESSTSTCDKAIDGNTDQMIESSKSCSIVGNDNAGWWKATAEGHVLISAIRIYNRLDCCTENLNDFDIYVNEVLCATYKRNESFAVRSFNCNLIGSRVKISSRKSGLSLCEVQAYGNVLVPMPLQNCEQSSTFSLDPCHKAIDDSSISCSHIGNEAGWWRADISKPGLIAQIDITNREACCRERLNDFSISVDSKVCHTHNSNTTFLVKSFPCGLVGQRITIKSNLFYLTICDVKVIGVYL